METVVESNAKFQTQNWVVFAVYSDVKKHIEI